MAQGNVLKLTVRLQGLDSLRGMAALAVVLYHYTFGYTQVVGKHIAPLLFLGEMSYSLYLVHQIAGYWVIKHLEAVGWDPDHAIWVAVLAAIVVATCVWKWVEVPAQKAIRGWYQETGKQYLLSSSPS